MKQLRRILITGLGSCRLVWPYDLSLLRILGILFLIGSVVWQINDVFLTSKKPEQVKTNTLYLTLFSEPNEMIEFDYELGDYYSFSKVKKSFGKIDISSIRRFKKEEFMGMILSTIPEELQPRLSNYLPFVMDTAQKYQVDPFWVLAVMWTESHFDNMSVSPNRAIGFMQIVPETGHFITQNLLKKGITYNDVKHYIKEPYINIELGTIYLKKLLGRFHNNYRLATVAYNLGPTRVLNRLNEGRQVGFENEYMNKVNDSYTKLTSNFISNLRDGNLSLQKTYVYLERPVRTHKSMMSIVALDFKKNVGRKNKHVMAQIPSKKINSSIF